MNYLLQFFSYNHLPPHLQAISKRFHDLAWNISDALPDNPEKSAFLRKLLEAKDCAVRAVIFKDTIVRPQTLAVEPQVEAS